MHLYAFAFVDTGRYLQSFKPFMLKPAYIASMRIILPSLAIPRYFFIIENSKLRISTSVSIPTDCRSGFVGSTHASITSLSIFHLSRSSPQFRVYTI